MRERVLSYLLWQALSIKRDESREPLALCTRLSVTKHNMSKKQIGSVEGRRN